MEVESSDLAAELVAMAGLFVVARPASARSIAAMRCAVRAQWPR